MDSDARSDPAPGSLHSWHQISSPRSIGPRNRAFCASVAWAMSVGPIIDVPMRKTSPGTS